MDYTIDAFRYSLAPGQGPYEFKDSEAWGKFTRYIELGDDGFALRQVDEFGNGYFTRYDRVHWEDQFGSLGDLRFGKVWVEHWGAPTIITPEQFEAKWADAGLSPVMQMKEPPPKTIPPWLMKPKS